MSAIVNTAGGASAHHEVANDGVGSGGDGHSAAKSHTTSAGHAAGSSSNQHHTSHSAPSVNTWGTIGHLTPDQEAALRSFETSAKPADIQVAKYTVETVQQCSLRFLRARGFDVPKALTLLSECVNKLAEMRASYWAERTANECADCDVDALQNFYPHVQAGFDRFNRPVLFEHSGGMQPSVILQMSSKKNLINYHWWYMETKLDEKFTEAAARVAANTREGESAPLPNISTCVVLDFKDLGMQHCSQKMLDQMKLYIGLDNICYPETLGKMIIINAPYIAVQTWGIVKRWLDPRTQQKIEILGPGPESIARLHEFISPENLPPAYGGTGPEIFHKKENVLATSVPRAGRLQKTIDVPPGKRLSVDSYVTEGQVELTITFTSAAVKMSQGLSPPVTMKPPATHDEGPARNKQIIPASSELRHVTIIWSNASKFSSRPLVYVLELLDDN